VRVAGSEAVRRHWPGTDSGMAVLWKLGGFPGDPPRAHPRLDAENGSDGDAASGVTRQ